MKPSDQLRVEAQELRTRAQRLHQEASNLDLAAHAIKYACVDPALSAQKNVAAFLSKMHKTYPLLSFTSAQLAEVSQINRENARKILMRLRKKKAVRKVGRDRYEAVE